MSLTHEPTLTPTLPLPEDSELVASSQIVRPWWGCAEVAAFITGADSLLAAQQRYNAVFARCPELAAELARRNRVWATFMYGAREWHWFARHVHTLQSFGISPRAWLMGAYQ